MTGSDISHWAGLLLTAGGLGALVGIERELRGHAAGIRTQALVAMASALVTGVGMSFTGPAADPTRVAAQVVSGIGFIGAGVILKNRGNIKGLTTAATLWLSAALGLSVGAGMVAPAVIAAIAALVLNYGLRVVKPLVRRRSRRTVYVDYEMGHGTIGPLLRSLQELNGSIEGIGVEDDSEADPDSLRHVWVRIVTNDNEELDDAVGSLLLRPEVREVKVVDG